MSNQLEIAARVRDLRESRNLRQHDVADYLGLKWSKYQRLESNGRFSYEQIILLAELFDVTPNYITIGSDENISILDANDNEVKITRLRDNTTTVIDESKDETLKKNLIGLFEQMSPDEKETLIAFIKKQMDNE